jgi:hypothetical protein
MMRWSDVQIIINERVNDCSDRDSSLPIAIEQRGDVAIGTKKKRKVAHVRYCESICLCEFGEREG